MKDYSSKHKRPAPDVRLERLHEGWVIQMLHIGPYATEPQTIQKMEIWMGENGYRAKGKHHEIYLSDPRKTAPSGLKTILRYPVERRTA